MAEAEDAALARQAVRQGALDVGLATTVPAPSAEAPVPSVQTESSPQSESRESTGCGTGEVRVVVCAPLTFYVCTGAPEGYQDGYCGDGDWPYPGVAACGWLLPRGTRFTIEGDSSGQQYVCDDVGAYTLGQWAGWEYTVEPWFYSYGEGRQWRDQFGEYVVIRIVP